MTGQAAFLNRGPGTFAVFVILAACMNSAGCGPPSIERVMDIGAGVVLAAEHGTIFYAFDTLARPGKPVELRVRVASAQERKYVRDVGVEFTLDGESLGKARTDDDGNARLEWTPPAAGDYDIKAEIVDVPGKEVDVTGKEFEEMLKVAPASLLVASRPADTRFVVIDLDHTVVASSFFRVLAGGARPMPRAVAVVREIAENNYSVIYLTQRPDLMTNKSKKWLADNGLPRAPLLVSTLRQAVGDSGSFKADRIRELRKEFPNIDIGIGDKFSDAQAYVANGMAAYLIPNYDRDGDDWKDFRKLAGKVRKLDRRVQVVDGWDEIRAGMFKGEDFSTTEYAGLLDAMASQLRQSGKSDDDDDEDHD